MITNTNDYSCDFCGGCSGEFNPKTGNHTACEKIAKLQSIIERILERYEEILQAPDFVDGWEACVEIVEIAKGGK